MIITIILLWAAFLLGWLGHSWYLHVFRNYSGTIVVEHDDERETTVYSLVLDEYPEKLEFKKVVILRVDAPDKKPNRE